MAASARISHSILDPYLTTPFRAWYRFLSLPAQLPPEAIVAAGHLCAVLAALAFALAPTSAWLAIIAAVLIAGHHFCDVFDGQHARATGQCRNGGELLDHFLDPLSLSYLVVGWGFAAGVPLWAIPGVIVVMATAVLTNLRAKLGDPFELSAVGPTEFKAGLVVLTAAAAVGFMFAPVTTQSVLSWLLAGASAAAVLRLPFEVVHAVRSVNRSGNEPDTSEWVAE